MQAPVESRVKVANKSVKLLPFIVIFFALVFRNFQNNQFNIASIYFIGFLSGGALSLSIHGLIMRFLRSDFDAIQ